MLEDTLVANPNLLMPGLTLVGRQLPTESGSLDLLAWMVMVGWWCSS